MSLPVLPVMNAQPQGWRETWRNLSRGIKLGGRDLARLAFNIAFFMAVNGIVGAITGSIFLVLMVPIALALLGVLCWHVDRREEEVEAMWQWAMKND